MGEEALVESEEAFGVNRLVQAVEDALVQVTLLVVQTRHDSVYGKVSVNQSSERKPRLTRGMHDAANHKATHGTAGKMKSWSLLHTKVPNKASLGEEIGR